MTNTMLRRFILLGALAILAIAHVGPSLPAQGRLAVTGNDGGCVPPPPKPPRPVPPTTKRIA